MVRGYVVQIQHPGKLSCYAIGMVVDGNYSSEEALAAAYEGIERYIPEGFTIMSIMMDYIANNGVVLYDRSVRKD